MAENETKTEQAEEKENSNQKEEKQVIWGQARVPNIEKGTNPYYPYVMMGTLVILFILSFVFARFTS